MKPSMPFLNTSAADFSAGLFAGRTPRAACSMRRDTCAATDVRAIAQMVPIVTVPVQVIVAENVAADPTCAFMLNDDTYASALIVG